MKAASPPPQEASRLAALRLLNILDSEPEERFDRLTRLARRLFAVPVAQVTLVDEHRQWFKSGIVNGETETPRDVSLCAHAILGDDVLLIPDTAQDQRFADNPLVTRAPGIRFYAGCPLKLGLHNLGSLCLIDSKPRTLSAEEIQLLRDLADMAQQELASFQMATTDHLTGLSNRRGFESLARHALSLCDRTRRSAVLVVFDLNGFKQINDQHGHAAGDRALCTFAQALVSVFRESDVIGRLGGDEFAVLMAASATEGVEIALDRLRSWLTSPEEALSDQLPLTFSAGHILCDPARHSDIASLLAEADRAMYETKKSRRP